VSDYLVKPISEKMLAEAILRERSAQAAAPEAQAEKKAANLIAFIGTRGGVGSSTIAANCAWIAAHERKRQTTLLDLDLQFGTVALALDIEPTRGLREALENPTRIDSLFLSSAAAKLGDRLTVLAAEEAMDGEVHFDPSAVDLLLGEINRSSQCIFVDLPRSSSVGRARLLQLATHVSVVTDVTLAGLRDCIRLVAMIERAAPQAKLLVVANRAGRTENGLSRPEFEKALGRRVDVVLPEDAKALATSVNRGKPLPSVAGSSKFVAGLRLLVGRLEGAEQKPGAKQKSALPFFKLLKKKA
jgi:pilus assembly protein CpaE